LLTRDLVIQHGHQTRILCSNDCPYEDYAEGGEFIDTVPISESDRRKIAYDNAKALYML
jgi:predicted TIM-barrel fold metal-dependent hydrolase